mmetsp:Transcript_12790/g.12601  ORF Transcript_12790/g.12601 Transcript_12790/m.12601 type:complete len:133 (-) Transcript_12790:36-434(-)
MDISYVLTTGKVMNFKRGQDLANGMLHFMKYQRPDVPTTCMEILFLTSNIYPSLVVGVVDGLNMDELFSSKQPVPNLSSSFSAARTAAGNHLASIATTMLTAVTGFTSQAAAKHTDTDQDETIDYKNMPPDV